MKLGVSTRSVEGCDYAAGDEPGADGRPDDAPQGEKEPDIDARREMVREMAFLAPVVLTAVAFAWVLSGDGPAAHWWTDLIARQTSN